MAQEQVPVLVVGGAVVGLSAGMFLADRGVRVVVVEAAPGSSPHPRATGFTPRTLELFRTVGLELADVRTASGPGPRKVRVESLGGAWHEEQSWTPPREGLAPSNPADHSFFSMVGIAQDRLEPLQERRARELGADIRRNTRMVDFVQDADAVTVTVRREDGSQYAIRADYLIAADGSNSTVRQKLQIDRTGLGHVRTIRSVIFRAPLEEYLESGYTQFTIDQPGFSAFLSTYHDGRWILMFSDDVERTEQEQLEQVHRALGRKDLPVELIATGRWRMGGHVATRFSDGRVFLAGDAAHTLPPNRGGYGANTGIEDAHNLAWKLEAVLSGASSPRLLTSYDAERRPIALTRHDQIFLRDDSFVRSDFHSDAELLDDAGMELGQLYRSAAVIGAGPELPPARRPDLWRGQPGTRAQHRWVRLDGRRLSTIDVLTRGWTLLTDGPEWATAAESTTKSTGIPITVHIIGRALVAEDDEDLLEVLGLHSGGASLIRPDGYIAWRSPSEPDDPARALEEALRTVASAAITNL
ncbi:2,4-dichlorophenol 6-monooxygenase [Actinomadura rayongensis]|uniref:2,4-dichlorophenol 6-monooxygenase n=1 Tax=Actinomadura rayongensis TaxID=1429076 RepID=A0A6I4WGU6_9ACTN|nr:2,4-dichlorophenol 6-monooxygenase [Actinomadura rayongensis]